MKLFAAERKIFEKQTGDWVVQVFEKSQRRELRFGNHIVQGAVSLSAPDIPVLEYVRAMLGGILFFPEPEYVLHLGLGTGSVPRFLHRHWPNLRQRVVEINPDVIEAAETCFGFPDSKRLLITQMDARDYIQSYDEKFDLIFVDAFVSDGAIGETETVAFFEQAKGLLNTGGWIVNNSWGSNDELLRRVQRCMTAVFPCLFAVSVRSHSNVIFIGGSPRRVPERATLASRAASLSHHIPFDFGVWARKLKPVGLQGRNSPLDARV